MYLGNGAQQLALTAHYIMPTGAKSFDQIEVLYSQLLGRRSQGLDFDIGGVGVRTSADVLMLVVENESFLSFFLFLIDWWGLILAIAFVAVYGMCQGIFKCRSHPERRGQ